MKYKMIPEGIFFRIKALKDFGNVKKGDLGGLVENKDNLSQEGNCWIFKDAKVFENAVIRENAKIYGYAVIRENALIYGDTLVFHNAIIGGQTFISENAVIEGNAVIRGNSVIRGYAVISGNAVIEGNHSRLDGHMRICGDAIVTKTPFSVNRTDGYTFTLVKCADGENRIIAGCRYFTFEEAWKHWRNKREGTDLQRETFDILCYLYRRSRNM